MTTLGQKIRAGLVGLGQKIAGTAKSVGTKVVSGVKSAVEAFSGPHVKTLSGTDKEMAAFAKMAYTSRSSSYGWTFQSSMSDKKKAVWFRGTEAIVAFRGTEVDDMEDLKNDVLIAVGMPEILPRAIEGARFVQSLLDGGKTKVIMTGHSLGGAIVMEVLKRNRDGRLLGYVYNPGVVKPMQSEAFARLRIFHIFGDPISAMARTIVSRSTRTFVGHVGMNPHTVNQFTR